MTGMGKGYLSGSGTVLALVAVLGLSACDESGKFAMPSFGGGTDAAATEDSAALAAAPDAAMVERDVEAPEVFQVTEQGLWDGRPSLGGVWVAHPDVTDPERVIIRNQTNGQFVIGALFRRERENPGPALQVSSDAAEALGVLAGAPTELNVVALRRQEAPAAAPEATIAFDEAPEVAATALAPVSDIATTAIDNAEAAQTAAAEPVAAEAVPAPAPAVSSSLDKPFLQVGIFSIEANANGTADKLRADGLSASIVPGQSQGRDFWRVIVGPAPTEADRAAVLEKVKALGFADAYAVSN